LEEQARKLGKGFAKEQVDDHRQMRFQIGKADEELFQNLQFSRDHRPVRGFTSRNFGDVRRNKDVPNYPRRSKSNVRSLK